MLSNIIKIHYLKMKELEENTNPLSFDVSIELIPFSHEIKNASCLVFVYS